MELNKLLEALLADSESWMEDSTKCDDWNDVEYHRGRRDTVLRIQKFLENQEVNKLQEVSRMDIHKNYNAMSVEDKLHVDRMYDLVNKYAKEHGIKLAYNDTAEKFVEAIATYIVESRKP
jgi:transcription initiation factor TFIIIB Brf1 subunit/transcription initiation factor TFIIB